MSAGQNIDLVLPSIKSHSFDTLTIRSYQYMNSETLTHFLAITFEVLEQ